MKTALLRLLDKVTNLHHHADGCVVVVDFVVVVIEFFWRNTGSHTLHFSKW